MVYSIFFSFWNSLVFIVFDENHCKALFDDKMKSFKSSLFGFSYFFDSCNNRLKNWIDNYYVRSYLFQMYDFNKNLTTSMVTFNLKCISSQANF